MSLRALVVCLMGSAAFQAGGTASWIDDESVSLKEATVAPQTIIYRAAIVPLLNREKRSVVVTVAVSLARDSDDHSARAEIKYWSDYNKRVVSRGRDLSSSEVASFAEMVREMRVFQLEAWKGGNVEDWISADGIRDGALVTFDRLSFIGGERSHMRVSATPGGARDPIEQASWLFYELVDHLHPE